MASLGARAQRGDAGYRCGHVSSALQTSPAASPFLEAAGPCIEVHKFSLGGEAELGELGLALWLQHQIA